MNLQIRLSSGWLTVTNVMVQVALENEKKGLPLTDVFVTIRDLALAGF